MIYKRLNNSIEKGSSDIKNNTLTQKYLEEAFRKCTDLSSDSRELESFIRNRESEHHLSSLRANLLRAFRFRADASVLEIGCESGAITRFLGEKCASVTAIESVPGKARLAQLRTRDQDNVKIICTALEDIPRKEKFDIVVALGPFEHNSLPGTAGDRPENSIRQLADHLGEEGTLLIAADNPFGLAWLSIEEKKDFQKILDENRKFTGRHNEARYFSQNELISILTPHFDNIDLYFPYPEYRLAECILSDQLINQAPVGELLGGFIFHDPEAGRNTSFNGKLALLELDRKKRLQSFTNSYLLIASRKHRPAVRMNELGMIFSKGRSKELQAVTRFVDHNGTGLKAVKSAMYRPTLAANGQLRLRESECNWIDGYSLQLELLLRAIRPDSRMEHIFEPAKQWLEHIRSQAMRKNERLLLDGGFIDHIWKNCFLGNQQCSFIDREWEWDGQITVNTLLIRSIFLFLKDAFELPGMPRYLTGDSTRNTIREIAYALDTVLTNRDFNDYCRLESEFQSIVYGRSRIVNLLEHKLILWNRSAYTRLGKLTRGRGEPRKNE